MSGGHLVLRVGMTAASLGLAWMAARVMWRFPLSSDGPVVRWGFRSLAVVEGALLLLWSIGVALGGYES